MDIDLLCSSGRTVIKNLDCVLGWEPFLWQIFTVKLGTGDKVLCLQYNIICKKLC